MIALAFVPVEIYDPDSRKILTQRPFVACSEWRGDESEGWYSAQAALACLIRTGQWQIRKAFDRCIAIDTPDTLLAVIQPQGRTDDEELTAVYIRHFSAPTDAGDFFVDTPLLTVPEVEAAPVHTSPAVRLRGGV